MDIMKDTDVLITLVVTTLIIFLFTGLVVLLLVIGTNRRNRHRAEMAEVRARHVEEVRKVEQEVMGQTLSEVGVDLHDNIGQLLTVVRMGVNDLVQVPEATARAAQVKEALDTTIDEVRRLSRALNLDRWSEHALGNVIRQECERVQRTGFAAIQVHVGDDGATLTPDQKVVLFRLFQEALNNALKHARATHIRVQLDRAGDGLHLRISDDGLGFDPEAAGGNGAGQGLHNLRRRARLIGYHCEVTSAPGQGTTVSVHR